MVTRYRICGKVHQTKTTGSGYALTVDWWFLRILKQAFLFYLKPRHNQLSMLCSINWTPSNFNTFISYSILYLSPPQMVLKLVFWYISGAVQHPINKMKHYTNLYLAKTIPSFLIKLVLLKQAQSIQYFEYFFCHELHPSFIILSLYDPFLITME